MKENNWGDYELHEIYYQPRSQVYNWHNRILLYYSNRYTSIVDCMHELYVCANTGILNNI